MTRLDPLAALALFMAGLLFAVVPLFAQDAPACADCHEDKKVHAQSVHKNLACSGCHQGFTDYPHPEPAANEDSHIARSRIVSMCARCHGNLKFVEDNRIPGRLLPVINYQQSVHGEAVAGGRLDAAICTDCHNSHEILAPNDPRSKVSRAHAPATCGQCHDSEFTQYQRSVHGVASAQGKSGAPTCTDCHGIHSIVHPAETRASDAEKALGKTSCSRCHDSEVLSREYSLPADRVRSYLDSYHGLAVKRGSVAVANCASCHGVHEILPSTDPKSLINPANLPDTCGKCHPGAGDNFARGAVHQIPGARDGQAVIYWVSVFYVVLIFATIGLMALHNLVDFMAKLRGAPPAIAEKFFVRSEVLQHALLMTSFIVLVVSGFALRWPESIFGVFIPASEDSRRWIHRIAGVVMIVLAAYHFIYLTASARGREFLRGFLPRLGDMKLGVQNFLFNLGLKRDRPEIGFPSYIEKVEYWALIWGTVIMAVTGLLLWFENTTLRVFPLWVLNLFGVIHYYEAILAALAILVWHTYFVVFDPTIYPLKSRNRRFPKT